VKNKLSFLVVFLVLLSVISISASALNIKEGNIKVDIPSEYTCVTRDNIDQNLPLLGEMKFTRNDFEKHLKENKIILFARNGQKDEIIIKLDKAVWSEEFDIDLLDADAFQKIAVSLSSGLDYEKVTLGENVFVRTNLVGKDNGVNDPEVVKLMKDYNKHQNYDLWSAFYEAMKRHSYSTENQSLYEDMKSTFFARIKELRSNQDCNA
jgi:biopolymer transport protein ExbD